MSIDRSTIRKGPASLTLGGGSFFFENGLTVNLNMEKETRMIDAFGIVKELLIGKTVEISGTPTQWDNLSVLFPYASTTIGTDIFGAADAAAVLTPINGFPITFANAAITSMSDVLLSGSGSQFGEMTITCLIANESEADALASYLAFGTDATGASLTGLDLTKILNAAYTATYNGATYHSSEGYTISFDMTLSENRIDGLGIVGMALQDLRVSATFIPPAMAEDALTTLIGFGGGIGKEAARYDLTIAGGATGDPSVVLQDCSAEPGGYAYGSDTYRTQALTFRTARRQTTGDNDALFSVGVVA